MPKATKIYINTWEESHELAKNPATDRHYLKVANAVKTALSIHPVLRKQLPDLLLSKLACYLTYYLEDMVSGGGQWDLFRRTSRERYGQPVPLFLADSEDYFDEEVNELDVVFLIWYFMKSWWKEEDKPFFHPYEPMFREFAELAFSVLSEAYEEVPENPNVRDFLAYDPQDFYFFEIGMTLGSSLAGIWMVQPELSQRTHLLMESLAERPGMNPEDVYQELVQHMLVWRMGPFGWTVRDWLAGLLPEGHTLIPALKAPFHFVTDYWEPLSGTEDTVELRNASTHMKATVRHEDWGDIDGSRLTPKKNMVKAALAYWDHGWRSLGNEEAYQYHEPSLETRYGDKDNLWQYQSWPELAELAHARYRKEAEQFREFSGGRKLLYLPAGKWSALEAAVELYFAETDPEERKTRTWENLKEHLPEGKSPDDQLDPDQPIVAYFSEQAGLIPITKALGAIPDPENPSFKAENVAESFWAAIMTEEVPWHFVRFLLDNYQKEYDFLDTVPWPGLISHLDLLMEISKGHMYHPHPRLQMKDIEEYLAQNT
ncbi:MAG: DUF3843 family protein [Bacteroidota bacterium]